MTTTRRDFLTAAVTAAGAAVTPDLAHAHDHGHDHDHDHQVVPSDPAPAFLYVYPENVHETYQRATEARAETLEVPAAQRYGDRRAMVKDPGGTLWQIASQM
jgi:uncharacterized glyoxalase superfamily protein PhnB